MTLDKKTILLVDDDPLLSRSYEKQITKAGAHVVSASNGLDGLVNLKKEKVDLILLDLMMPKMNGYEMLKLIKEDPKTKDIPVIILTNLNDHPEDIEKVKKLGIEEYLVKSDLSLGKLVEIISHHIK